MTKAQLITKIAGDLGVFKPVAAKAVEAVISNITNALAEEEPVVFRGFGKFTVRHRKSRKGRNPRTGETIEIPARKVPIFKPGGPLRHKVKLAPNAVR